MNDYTANMFTAEELKEIRKQFYCVDRDIEGTPRLFFDNAGGRISRK